ncbi:hypothetical protein WI41_07850 [Burkholderia latens]|uniref:Uncharacterized protein n=1 Tax=Burkholderia latens TaxID=488446 RepID=A0AAP1C830_9BURK|nr:hypothetical protein WI41_07850 [Burkholderia latens]
MPASYEGSWGGKAGRRQRRARSGVGPHRRQRPRACAFGRHQGKRRLAAAFVVERRGARTQGRAALAQRGHDG